MNTRFITIEGGEGVGKSTLIHGIKTWLIKHDVTFQITREPGGTPVAEAIRELLLEDRQTSVLPMTELLLIFAARYQHIHEMILPALQTNQVVLCDRFIDSSYAYQGIGRRLGIESVAQLEQMMQTDLQPDLTLLLDLPVEIGQQRKCDDIPDRIEQASSAFFERVRQGYLQRAAQEPERFVVLDAGLSPENVVNHAIDSIKNIIKTNK